MAGVNSGGDDDGHVAPKSTPDTVEPIVREWIGAGKHSEGAPEMAKEPRRQDEWSGSILAGEIYDWYEGGGLILAELRSGRAEARVGDTVLVRMRDGAPGTEKGYMGRGKIVSRLSPTEVMLKPLEMFD